MQSAAMFLDYQNFKLVSYRKALFRLRAPKHAAKRLASESLFPAQTQLREIAWN